MVAHAAGAQPRLARSPVAHSPAVHSPMEDYARRIAQAALEIGAIQLQPDQQRQVEGIGSDSDFANRKVVVVEDPFAWGGRHGFPRKERD